MDIFLPNRVIVDRVNLIGSFRYAYGCYFCNDKLFWSNGTIERLNLTREQCNRLQTVVACSDALKKWVIFKETYTILTFILIPPRKLLRTVTLSTERGALKHSTLPSILARSPFLTRVTLLNGATNHILRILGKNCPHLQILDVSHSNSVTDSGLGGLLLKSCPGKSNPLASLTPSRARSLPPGEKNPCADTLIKVIMLGTDVSHSAFNLACILMEGSYYLAFLPDLMIVRPHNGNKVGGQMVSVQIEHGDSLTPIFGRDEAIQVKLNQVMTRFAERRRGTETTFQVLDHHPGRGSNATAQNFLRGADSYISEAMIGTRIWKSSYHITRKYG